MYLFTALLEHIDKNPIVFQFPSSLPLYFIPQFSPFFLLTAEFSQCVLHACSALHILSLASLYVCLSSSLYLFLLCLTAGNLKLYFFCSLPLLFCLSLSLYDSLYFIISLKRLCVLLCRGPNFRTPIPPDCAPLSLLFSSFCPSPL